MHSYTTTTRPPPKREREPLIRINNILGCFASQTSEMQGWARKNPANAAAPTWMNPLCLPTTTNLHKAKHEPPLKNKPIKRKHSYLGKQGLRWWQMCKIRLRKASDTQSVETFHRWILSHFLHAFERCLSLDHICLPPLLHRRVHMCMYSFFPDR